jgi:hypothetical protein
MITVRGFFIKTGREQIRRAWEHAELLEQIHQAVMKSATTPERRPYPLGGREEVLRSGR